MHCLGHIPCSMSPLLQPANGHVTIGVVQLVPEHTGVVHVVPEHAGDAGGGEKGTGSGLLIGGGGIGGRGGDGRLSGGAMGNSTFNMGPALQQPACSPH